MRTSIGPLVLLTLTTCAPSPAPARPPAAQLIDLAIDPPAASHDRVSRRPSLVLAFDRPLATPHPDALWLIAGRPTDALASDARRGALGASSHRIDAEVAFADGDPSRLRITPREPLSPDAPFTLVTTVRLITEDGAPTGSATDGTGPMLVPFTVAPARDCPPLARLRFPLADGAPRALTHIVVGFDRPVRQFRDDAPATLQDPSGEVPARASLACGTIATGFWCVELAPSRALEPRTTHTVAIGSVHDDAGLVPQSLDLEFTTGDDRRAPPAPPSAPLACAVDELVRAPWCVRVTADALLFRGVTTAPGALQVRADNAVGESAAGVEHTVRLEGLAPGAAVRATVWTLALDGTISAATMLDAVDTATPLPRVRITEVLAHPRGASTQEFVEIVNDGTDDASLGGLRIVTATGSSVLPDAHVAPNARAVIVGAAFDPAAPGGDEPVAPGTVVVRTLGTLAGHGIADHGVDVWLADGAGHEITRCPLGTAGITPRTGVSVVRADARMREDDAASWSYDAENGSTPGLPDRLR